MAERFPTHPLFTLRTRALAGRSAEQQKLRAAVEQLRSADDETRLFYIAGAGGMGKTRLLEWLRNELSPELTGGNRPVLCTRIIDFYSSHVRIALDLIEAIAQDIRQGLDGKYNADEIFRDFDDLLQRFRSQQNAGVQSDIRRQMMEAFDAAWRKLAQRGCRLVVLLDTAELLRFHDDPVRARFEAPLPSATAWRWLQRTVERNDLPGALFVTAGRRKEAPELYDQLCKLAGAKERVIELGGFSPDGVGEYIQYLSHTLAQNEHSYEAGLLSAAEGFDDALVGVFHRLTGGLPIALAVALQLYLDRTPPALMALIDDLLEGKDAPPNMQEVVRATLVQALGDYAFGQDASVIVRYMALTRRGLTPERFKAIWKGDYQFPALDKDFAQLQQQIFIKTRPDGSLVLHDEIADWLEAGFYSEDRKTAREIYEWLVAEYNREIEAIEDAIVRFNQRTNISDEEIAEDDIQSLPESAPSSRPPATPQQLTEERALFDARDRRRHLTADRMSYALRWSPAEGYKHYYELAEEIFSTGLREYEAHIRAVFLEWWGAQEAAAGNYRYRNEATAAGVTPDLIDGDFALRAVQRAYTEQQPAAQRLRNTFALAQRILDAGDFDIPRHARLLLEVYINLCRGRLEGETTLEEVRAAFDRCMAALEQEKRTHGKWNADLQGWLIHAARAFGYYAYGFFERSRGHYGRAARRYTDSLWPYRDLKFEVSQARSLNDKAYALALVGDSLKAEAAVKDALELRQRLGFGFTIGLSLNTYGIVLTMSERPVSAEYYCRRALEIFRRVDSPYWQMLAHRALSEAHRRDAERLTQARGHYLGHLENALAESEQSYAFAQKLLQPPDSLLADILDEYGCVYRDLAHFCWQNRDDCADKHDANESFRRAEELLRQSIQAVAGIGASERRVDSAINLAYLYYWRIDSVQGDGINADQRGQMLAWLDEAETRLQEAIGFAPEDYRNPAHPRHQRGDPSHYWTHLSKAWSLAALILQERRLLAERAGELAADKEPSFEDELLRAVMRILYYASRLPGNVRAVRRALQIAYDVFKPLASDTLERFYAEGAQLFPAEERDAWQRAEHLLRAHLRDNFGIGDFSSQ
ncbi:MAG: ATP-binding protein [Chloroflexi bacterium]|nr:ATP-binding protein [Chloroflexota bacterium]